MNTKHFQMNLFVFFITYLIIVLLLWLSSYYLLVNDYIQLEKDKNNKNAYTLLFKMNTTLKNIYNTTNDYSKWDDTYNFINTLDKDYIFENFREGTTTLEDLNLDFIFYVNLDNKIIFSKYAQNTFINKAKNFEKNILEKYANTQTLKIITKNKSHLLYLVKSEILKSDESGTVNGYIYSGKIITNEKLNDLTKVFKSINIDYNQLQDDSIDINLSFLKNIKLSSKIDNKIVNTLEFYENDKYIFSIKTYNEKEIINKGKSTIFFYNLIISVFIFLILFLIYKSQKKLVTYNIELEKQVKERTRDLNITLRTVENKNNELYKLSNIDYLTQIRNRRNFFVESKKILQEAIEQDKHFSTLMIDIDHFKKINDIYGHNIGDKVLKEFCKIVNTIISENEIFGRLGGEEFCITFYDKDIHLVNKISEEIRKTCENFIIEIENQKISFTISLGLSDRQNFRSIDEILQAADNLLYDAKNMGRNCLIRYSKTV